jgi:hypothetical protein
MASRYIRTFVFLFFSHLLAAPPPEVLRADRLGYPRTLGVLTHEVDHPPRAQALSPTDRAALVAAVPPRGVRPGGRIPPTVETGAIRGCNTGSDGVFASILA